MCSSNVTPPAIMNEKCYSHPHPTKKSLSLSHSLTHTHTHTHTHSLSTYVPWIYVMEIYDIHGYFSATAVDTTIDHFDVAGVYLPLLESG